MIFVVEGAVGCGKTYWCTRRVIQHLRAGGVVCSNLTLNFRALCRATGRRLSKRQLIEINADMRPSCIPRGDVRGRGSRRVLVILDEALNWFDSRAGKDDERKAWPEWLRQSDKLGQDVFFVAQRFDRAAKWLRELAQIVVTVRNLGKIRVCGIRLGAFLGLSKISVAVMHDQTIQQVVGRDWYVLQPEVWDCYDTAVLYGFSASDNAYDDFRLWPRHRFPKFAFAVLGLWVFWGLLRWFIASW